MDQERITSLVRTKGTNKHTHTHTPPLFELLSIILQLILACCVMSCFPHLPLLLLLLLPVVRCRFLYRRSSDFRLELVQQTREEKFLSNLSIGRIQLIRWTVVRLNKRGRDTHKMDKKNATRTYLLHSRNHTPIDFSSTAHHTPSDCFPRATLVCPRCSRSSPPV